MLRFVHATAQAGKRAHFTFPLPRVEGLEPREGEGNGALHGGVFGGGVPPGSQAGGQCETILYDFELGLRQLGAQAVGALTIIFVMGGIAYAFFKIQNAIMKGGIRPTEEVELMGVDRPEMGVLAYGDFTTSELILQGDDPSEDKVLASTPSPDPTIGR